MFFCTISGGTCARSSDSRKVSSSEKLPWSKTSRNSQPSPSSPWIECGMPAGKYHRSLFPISSRNIFPSGCITLTRALPASIMAHSLARCQCSSRNDPAVSRIVTPARSFDGGSSRSVTWCVQPPASSRLGVMSKEYHVGPGFPVSVNGGLLESGFSASSGAFSGPGSLALSPCRPDIVCSRLCANAPELISPAPASAAAPTKLRRETVGSPASLSPTSCPASFPAPFAVRKSSCCPLSLASFAIAFLSSRSPRDFLHQFGVGFRTAPASLPTPPALALTNALRAYSFALLENGNSRYLN